MKAGTIDDIRHALLLSGLEPDNYTPGKPYAVPDTDEGQGDRIVATLRLNLPRWITVDWTGNSNTDGDGETTSDILFMFDVKHESEA